MGGAGDGGAAEQIANKGKAADPRPPLLLLIKR
jgi:hypothetical protein